jgi:centromere protein X
MPPKQSGGPRGRPTKKSSLGGTKPRQAERSPNPFSSNDEGGEREEPQETTVVEVEEEEQPENAIPPELLTRILHEFFQKDDTRITKDANEAVARYMDIFVREAIARAAAEGEGGFLEVIYCSVPTCWHLRTCQTTVDTLMIDSMLTNLLCRSKIWKSWLRSYCSTSDQPGVLFSAAATVLSV